VSGLPAAVRIGAYWFPIRLVGADDLPERTAYGACYRSGKIEIRIRNDIAGALLVDTLIHEIFHAIWWVDRLGDDDGEERIVNNTASFLTQVLLDNPHVGAFIEATLAPLRLGPPES